MDDEDTHLAGPDFAEGFALSGIAEGAMVAGHAHGEPALLARQNGKLFAIGAVCTHYGAPLAQGLLVEDTVRCPWHHACFSLRSGEALRAPALNPVSCWRVETKDGRAYVRDKIDNAGPPSHPRGTPVQSIVIVGGGAAGHAAAETLRREGHTGSITLLSADDALPCDRPNLSKNYLAGTAPEEWIALRPAKFFSDHGIDLRLNTRVTSLDIAQRRVLLAVGSSIAFERLLLATGAEPVRLEVPGADRPHVHYLRTWADSRALIAKAGTAKRAVVIGASFIGLEVTASLRARNVEVHVVGRETRPMEKILGPEAGDFIRQLHEDHGVTFHFGTTASAIGERDVTLKNGATLEADLVVAGIGVRPAVALAEKAGLAMDRGVTVNAYLETSAPGVFAAGDIARWPDPLTGERIRVEHWVVAQRQGQCAARNMLGQRERFDAVPFFWTEQYDFGLAYVGHAERWDRAEIDGRLDSRDCAITYSRSGKKLAVALIHRDLAGLHAEVGFERASGASELPIVHAGPDA